MPFQQRTAYAVYGLVLLAMSAVPAAAQRPEAAVLLDGLCADTLRHNEEDRLFGTISMTVRTTLKYQGGVFSPDLIDDAMQDTVANLVAACPKIKTTADANRLGMVVEIARDATTKRMQDKNGEYSERETATATAADLSEELSAPEIDSWLEALPARRRALALLLYASNLKPKEVADAVGLTEAAIAPEFRGVKGDLLKFFKAEVTSAPPPPIPGVPGMEYRVSGQNLAALLTPPQPAAVPKPDPAKPEGDAAKAPDPAGPKTALRITGIAGDIFSGWSLLATVTGLPPERGLDISEPTLVEPNSAGRRRMLVVASEEISDPHDQTRRFLLKAYAIDADREGSGLRDGFHLSAAPFNNSRARDTLRNNGLAAIEVSRCLWADFGTGEDPGFCH
jgi:DNA-directed RNA polymerase specialized sigma24 family protein